MQGVTGQTKTNPIMCLMAIVPTNISTQGCKIIEPSMMNIYWTKVKLHAAANQAIYLVIFHRVVGSLYLNWYIYLLLDRCRVFKEGSD